MLSELPELANDIWQYLRPETAAHLSGAALFVALAGFGLVVGVLTGIFGIAGGFMMVPLMHMMFGFRYEIAIGTSLCFTVGSGATGFARHLRLRNVEVRSTIILAGAAIIGAVLGATLLSYLKSALEVGESQSFNHLMDGMFIALLLTTAYMLFRGTAHEGTGSRSVLQRLPVGPYVDLPDARRDRVSLPGLLAVGLFVGVLTGLLGIGGGVLFMPLLILVVGLSAHQAVGTSLGVVVFSSTAGTIKHGLAGNVNLVAAMALLVGSTIGVQMGASICQRMHSSRLRRYFSLLALAVAIALVVQLAWNLL